MQGQDKSTRTTGRLTRIVTGVLLVALTGLAAANETSCRAIPPLPGTPAGADDTAAAARFCTIDFSSGSTAVCPKTWSTSAAALVYDLEGTKWEGRRSAFEEAVCPRGTKAIGEAASELAVFKHSMNFPDTSGTYAPSILLYYHLSRWLGATVRVPATAELQFDREWYTTRVVTPGLALAAEHPSRKMLQAAWRHLDEALAGEGSRSEFLHPASGDVWGAALLFTGRRYGPEMNGTRASGWGSGQNRDFQQTAPFLALRNPAELSSAAAAGITAARGDPAMADALAVDTSTTQVAWWMLELLDLVVLDYLLGQQDRVGNIDYQWRWLWLENGEPRSATAANGSRPAPGAVRLQTTWLNDNDAGVRVGYANYARSTGMLKDLRHFNPDLYSRLKSLARDVADQGPVYRALADHYQMTGRDLAALTTRVAEVDSIITADCKAGRYRFDLSPLHVLDGTQGAVDVDCD